MIGADALSFIHSYGYAGAFPVMALGGPLAALAIAALAAQFGLNAWILWPLAVLADLAADIMWYGLGFLGRERVFRWLGRFFLLPEDSVRLAEERFRRHGAKIIFASKVTMGFGFLAQLMLVLQGFLRVPVPVFLGYNFLGGAVLSGAAVFGGYYFGRAVIALTPEIRVVVLFAFVVAVWLLVKLARRIAYLRWVFRRRLS